MTGQLILAATPIGNIADASMRLKDALKNAQVIAAEDSRRAKRLIKDLEIETNAQIWSFFDAVEERKIPDLITRIQAGDQVLVISDAGMPTLSDPGYRIVQAAIKQGIKISVIPGPSAILTALALSGLPVDRFSFEGFLPRKTGERKKILEGLASETRTMIFFEAPHRLSETLHDFKEIFGSSREAVICRELTKIYEEVFRGNFASLVVWANKEILGEITLVVAGNTDVKITSPKQWVDLVATRVNLGLSKRDAITEVAKELRVPKRDVYDAVLENQKFQ